MPTRSSLQLAAFGAAGALIVLLAGPFNTTLALINPLLYAVTATVTLLIPMAARLWSGLPFSAFLCALLAGVIAAPFSALGFLLPLALAVPAVCFDAVLWRQAEPGLPRVLSAAAAGGIAIWALSLPVIDPTFLTAFSIVALALIRVASFAAGALLARAVASRLYAGGVLPARARALSG